MHPCRSVQRVRCLQARKARSSRSVLDRTSCDTGKRLAHRLWATVTGDRCTPVGSGATAGHHVCLPVPLRRRRPDARLSSSRPGCTRPQQCQQSTSSHSCFHSCASAARSTQCGHTSNANAVCNRRFAAFLCYFTTKTPQTSLSDSSLPMSHRGIFNETHPSLSRSLSSQTLLCRTSVSKREDAGERMSAPDEQNGCSRPTSRCNTRAGNFGMGRFRAP